MRTIYHKLGGREITVHYIEDWLTASKVLHGMAKTQDTAPHFTPIALDFETTGLDPYASEHTRARLSCLSIDHSIAYVIDHDKCGKLSAFKDLFETIGCFYVFNNGFEGKFLQESGIDVDVYDVGIMRKMVMGGGPLKLSLMALWDLSIKLPKDEQNSDWNAEELTDSQIGYAGADAIITRRLAHYWYAEMNQGHWDAFYLWNDAWMANNEMEEVGMRLDQKHHGALVETWIRRRKTAYNAMRRLVPMEQLDNIRSKKQVSNFIKSVVDEESLQGWPATEKTKQLSTERGVLRKMSYLYPYPFSRFLATLMVFNRADFYVNTFGEKLLNTAAMTGGYLRPRYNLLQAVTGRYSSSGDMNGQNLPRAPLVRRSFIAFNGCNMLIADYSGIELRVLAELSNDEQLKQDVIYGDVHSESAIAIFGLNPDEFKKAIKSKEGWAKELRSKAKAFSFQLTYGAGLFALSMALRCSEDEAAEYLEAWKARYPRAYNFRNYMNEKMMFDGFLPVVTGRTIFVRKAERSLPVAANYPVQGAAADVMVAALIAAKQKIDASDAPIWLQATIHDEILLQVQEGYEKLAENLLHSAMQEGWLRVFPNTSVENLVESGVGKDWSAKA